MEVIMRYISSNQLEVGIVYIFKNGKIAIYCGRDEYGYYWFYTLLNLRKIPATSDTQFLDYTKKVLQHIRIGMKIPHFHIIQKHGIL